MFVIEAFVPEPQAGPPVVAFDDYDSVVLSITTHDEAGRSRGHYISLSESGGVRMRPWAIRRIDRSTRRDGAALLDFVSMIDGKTHRVPFTAESARHVSVYRTIHSPVRPEGSATS